MSVTIEVLESKRKKIIQQLKAGEDCLSDLQDIDESLAWLKLIKDNDLKSAKEYKLEAIPFANESVYSYFRLMIDMETDNEEEWVQYEKEDGSHYELSYGDYIMVHKGK